MLWIWIEYRLTVVLHKFVDACMQVAKGKTISKTISKLKSKYLKREGKVALAICISLSKCHFFSLSFLFLLTVSYHIIPFSSSPVSLLHSVQRHNSHFNSLPPHPLFPTVSPLLLVLNCLLIQ